MNIEEKKELETIIKQYKYDETTSHEKYIIQFLLNLIEKQQAELEKKDKIIDLIAEMINNHDIDEDICSQMGKDKYCNDYTKKENCIKCIKEYFREKVSDNK